MIKSNAWPFIEAERILSKINNTTPKKGYVLFETGYGPSGLPHIGTFGEVVRTTMVRNAFANLCSIPTKLFAFSDDMDALRKVPDNIPNRELIKNYLGKPLTSIPDPFEKEESYAHYMNNRLKKFLDEFDFDYEFKSSTELYKDGQFDTTLLVALKNFDKIMNVMLPTLGEERQATYSPFLPICPETGVVLQVPIVNCNTVEGTITYKKENSEELVTIPVTGGHCKLQWKADWALRWAALEVDYEMFGKDLIPSAELSTKLCEIMGGIAPINFFYELFLDESGHKISKSKGNGISIEEWLKYGGVESLALYMYQSPKRAKRLYFDVIPKNVDDYIAFNSKYEQNSDDKFENPVWHIHNGNVPKHQLFGLDFSLLLNLASACNPEDKEILWSFIRKYAPQASPANAVLLDRLVDYAIQYYNDFIKPYKKYRVPDIKEIEILQKIKSQLLSLPSNATVEEIQNIIYIIAKESNFDNLKDYFKMLYEVLLGQSQGPRMGTFIAVYGIKEMIDLIDSKLN